MIVRICTCVVVRADVAVAILAAGGNAHEQRVGDERGIERSADAAVIVATHAGFGVARIVALGIDLADADGTTLGVLTEQGSLRTAQHIDALDIAEREHAAERGGLIDVVDVDRYTGLKREAVISLPEAADVGDQRVATRRALFYQRGARGHRGETRDVGDTARLEVGGAERRDRHRGVLWALGAVPPR